MNPRTLIRVLLGYMAVADGLVGLWASVSPRAFYDTFPGGGRMWTAVDGPYNEHLVRDFGALNLALAVVLAFGAVTLGPTVVRAGAWAMIVYSAPHLVYHLRHLDLYGTGDKIGNVFALSLNVLVPVVVLVLARHLGAERDASSEGAPAVP
jgi:hypothetical protein